VKKFFIVVFIFIFLSSLSFYTLYTNYSYNNYNKFAKIGQTSDSKKIVFSAGSMKSEDIYNNLKIYLDKYNANLYCLIIDNQGKIPIYTNYVYIDNLKLFNNFKLLNGRFFNNSEKESNKYLSTIESSDTNQIGSIADFTGQKHLEIRTLKSKVDSTNLFNRSFYLQVDKSKIDFLIKDLETQKIMITIASTDESNKDF